MSGLWEETWSTAIPTEPSHCPQIIKQNFHVKLDFFSHCLWNLHNQNHPEGMFCYCCVIFWALPGLIWFSFLLIRHLSGSFPPTQMWTNAPRAPTTVTLTPSARTRPSPSSASASQVTRVMASTVRVRDHLAISRERAAPASPPPCCPPPATVITRKEVDLVRCEAEVPWHYGFTPRLRSPLRLPALG